MKLTPISILFCLLFIVQGIFSQPFQTIGNAYNIAAIPNVNCVEAEACFTLTDNVNWQQGAVWDLDTIDLNLAFDATFCMFIGSNDGGADGFAFVIRDPNSNPYGEVGGGIGYGTANGTQGIFPSIAVEFDSFYNAEYFDIQDDHTSLVLNGNVTSVPAIAAIPLLPNNANVEDNAFHTSRIVWDPVGQNFSMYFDGNLRFTYNDDLINNVFNGDSKVLWGFTASTGGLTNLHQICFPKLNVEIPDQIVCFGDSAQVNYFHENLSEYYWVTPINDTILRWNSGMGVNLTDTVFYTQESGNYSLNIEFNNKFYTVNFNIFYDNTNSIVLGSDTTICPGQSLLLSDINGNSYSLYLWKGGSQSQSLSVSAPGIYWCEVGNIPQCKYRDSIEVFNHLNPAISVIPFDSVQCIPANFEINANVTPANSVLEWTFTDGTNFGNSSSVDFQPNSTGFYGFSLEAISNDGCINTFTFPNNIEVKATPIADFSFEIIEGSDSYELNFMNESIDYLNLTWEINNVIFGDLENLQVSSNQEVNEAILIASNGICSDTIVKSVVLEDLEVLVPNIITNPGAGGPNSNLTLFKDSFKSFEIQILNRWGQVVFEGQKDINLPLFLWNGIDQKSGKKCSNGTYFVLLEGILKNGESYKYNGFVTIAGM